ncbi:MAG: NupC/NupG family nucleoside CNT transporter [Phycisphaerales bacterium]
MDQFSGVIGAALLILIAWAFSTARNRVNWRLVASGLLLQIALAFLLLRFPPVVTAFGWLAAGVTRVISFADEGTAFIFGSLADASQPWGFVFAIKVLPIIVFFAALMSVLYHLGIMQRVVALVASLLRATLGITGAEALSAASNLFVGQTEAPLTVRPYIAGMTRSQLMAIMTGGFATIAGSVMAAYIGILGDAYGQIISDAEAGRVLFARHLLTATVLSAPAGLVMAKIMLPETEEPRPETLGALMTEERTTRNVLDAAAAGATDGLRLAANVAAMLVAFVALLAMVNWPLSALSRVDLDWLPIATWRQSLGMPEWTIQNLLGGVLRPLCWCLGAPWAESSQMGSFLGTGIVATEFIAYLNLADAIKSGSISPRTAAITTYCLCGFANIPSIAIQIGGLSALAPSRRADLSVIGPRAMLAGALACWMTGAVAGLFIA